MTWWGMFSLKNHKFDKHIEEKWYTNINSLYVFRKKIQFHCVNKFKTNNVGYQFKQNIFLGT